MTLIKAERLVTRDGVHEPGFVRIEGDRIVEVGPDLPGTPDHEVGTLAPGLVDVHCHGAGGASFGSDAATAIRTHRAAGTTSLVASTVTESIDDLEQQVRDLAPLVEQGELAGVHLEGPWLAEEFKGAHPAELLRDPAPEDMTRILEAGRDTVRMVTLAPELEGGIDAVSLLVDLGVVAAVGHTAATYEQVAEALAAGVSGATHLFNAMKPIHHRAPGPIMALMGDSGAWLEIVADGHHLHPEVVRYVASTYPGRVVLITDAMAAAGAPDGSYVLGQLHVTVTEGVARISGTDTIAGSTLTLAKALQNAITYGVEWTTAIAAATWNPAAYLGLDEVGDLAAGLRADAVELADDWSVTRVLHRGEWL